MEEKNTSMLLLFDCYQSLLTDKQRQMMDLYYNQDFSLAEIALELKISRQGVYDHLKRTGRLLKQYEDRMGLLQIFQRQSQLILRMKETIAELEIMIDEEKNQSVAMMKLKILKESIEKLYQLSIS